ncbi:MAG: ureidoglycolate lyase, partial [SAR324 cluster bacterium]|nr:ureidoglycolate lyase [SAR324 cluster bacterium]
IFSCSHKQGVNFKPGVWHHPLLVLAEQQDFLVIDRAGEGENLVEQDLASPIMVDLAENNPQGRLEPRPRQ